MLLGYRVPVPSGPAVPTEMGKNVESQRIESPRAVGRERCQAMSVTSPLNSSAANQERSRRST